MPQRVRDTIHDLTPSDHSPIAARMMIAATICFTARRRRAFAVWAALRVQDLRV
jgi:cytochrome c-type biogenesis protein CcmH/NrfG